MKGIRRSPQMQQLFNSLTKKTHGISNSEAVIQRICAKCKNTVVLAHFRDDLSRKEYTISALCQECQDNVFGR